MTTECGTCMLPDVIVIGAGHAGCEAALAAARTGSRVLVLTPNLDRVGFMPCNPSIGGPAKGHIVAEIDALGGEMARAIDRTALQIRMLNESRGPAVQALRAQADKTLYALAMKEALETTPGVELRQEAAVRIEAEQSHGTGTGTGTWRVHAVVTDAGNTYPCASVVITAGTFLRGAMIAGAWRQAGGRAGDSATGALAASISDIGIQTRRFKTGTPPRIDARSVDFSLTAWQPGSPEAQWFSRDGRDGRIERLALPPLPLYPGHTTGWRTQLPCYLVHTDSKAHQIIAANVHRAPMYDGSISGTGPRYCPSIEDKIMRFPDKSSHGLFLEPEGWRTTELYVQGANTSLPHDVQEAFLRTIPALRNASITRYGYAVEYDAIEPSELTPWFESKRVQGLFLAGQVNGTSGYEEAAGQGLLAGLNAARRCAGLEPVTLQRHEAYIGVMADDLTSQEFSEPYRMMTSRAEHRLSLRFGNADDRLADTALAWGLIGGDRHAGIIAERTTASHVAAELETMHLSPNQATNVRLAECGLEPVTRSMLARDYLRRPHVSLNALLPALHTLHPQTAAWGDLSPTLLTAIEVQVKYATYIAKEREQITRIASLNDERISPTVDYATMSGLRNEARERLMTTRPTTVGQAGRIAGVTPADLAVLLIHLRRTTRVDMRSRSEQDVAPMEIAAAVPARSA